MESPTFDHLQIWKQKPVLRALYKNYFERIIDNCGAGPTVEIGSGVGAFRDTLGADLVSLDIQPFPWSDLAADAQFLPFCDESVGNLVLIDTLHHIEFPVRFLEEAQRVLRTGGRIVMIEPAITPLSWPVYKYLHDEDVDCACDPFRNGQPDSGKNPFAANQAIPTLMFVRQADAFRRLFPGLSLVKAENFSLYSYVLSGGFQKWHLLPLSLLNAALSLERILETVFARFFGFRIFIVIEKAGPG